MFSLFWCKNTTLRNLDELCFFLIHTGPIMHLLTLTIKMGKPCARDLTISSRRVIFSHLLISHILTLLLCP